MEYDKPGLNTEKPKKKPTMWEGVIEKSIVLLNDSENQKRIKQFVIDPVLTHVMNRMFPYILLICVLFWHSKAREISSGDKLFFTFLKF